MRRRGRAPEEAPTTSPYADGLRLLGRRDFTQAELRTRLLERGHDVEGVEAALVRLTETRALDDRRTALAFVRTASRVKGGGRLRIQRELQARGVSAAILREALAELPVEADTQQIQRYLARKRERLDLDDPAARRRLLQQLLRRGFSAESIRKVLKDAEREFES